MAGEVQTSGGGRAGAGARLANAALGAWLVASAFLWPHLSSEAFDAMTVGLGVAMVALTSWWLPRLRFVNLAFAAWLLVDTTSFRHGSTLTLANHAIVSLAIAVLALVPSEPRWYAGAPSRT